MLDTQTAREDGDERGPEERDSEDEPRPSKRPRTPGRSLNEPTAAERRKVESTSPENTQEPNKH